MLMLFVFTGDLFAQLEIETKDGNHWSWIFHRRYVAFGDSVNPKSNVHIFGKEIGDLDDSYSLLQFGNIYSGYDYDDGLKIGLENYKVIYRVYEQYPMSFESGGQTRIYVTGDGNVGINTGEPFETLDVNGTVRIRGGNPTTNAVLKSTNSGGTAVWQSLNLQLSGTTLEISDFNTSVDLSTLMDNTDNQQLSLSGNSLSLTSGGTVDLSLFMDNTDNQQLSLSGSILSLSTGGSVDLSFLDQSGMSVDDADADPTNELQELDYNNGQLTISTGNTVDIPFYWLGNGDDIYNRNIAYRVAVGLMNPKSKFHVHSTETISTGGGGLGSGHLGLPTKRGISRNIDYANIQITNTQTGKTENDGLHFGVKGNRGFISLKERSTLTLSAGGRDGLFITKDGKIGVGSGAPLAKLDVKGDIKLGYGNTQANGVMRFNGTTIQGRIQGEWKDMAAQSYWTKAGNSIHYNEGSILVKGENNFSQTNDQAFVYFGDYQNSISAKYGSGLHFNAYAAQDAVVVLNYSGNVGIGKDDPQYKLDVKGIIHACKAIVKYDGWCDYVFDAEYKLPDLDNIECFIKENKHLPVIPSESEVKETGVDLGEMNKLLLKKVEELTLYIIEQNKRIEALEGNVGIDN